MPRNGPFQVKCEPPSDEEDNCPQLSEIFLCKPPSEFHCSKTNTAGQNDERSSADLLQHFQSAGLEELAPAPPGPAATPVLVKQEPGALPALETLASLDTAHHNMGGSILERHNMAMLNSAEELDSSSFTPLLIKDEPLSEGEFQPASGDEAGDGARGAEHPRGSPKSWTQRDMEHALDALRNQHMSLTKASARFGIPSTTLWQRAHRAGIDTPKKEAGAKSWGDAELRAALHALRAGHISANKASKAYGIPSSTLYKIARREGIRLAAPFNAAPVAWRRGDLTRALAAIRAGAASVQRAAVQYGIPTGTLYGRCKREGIELSRSNPTPWSEDAMGEALEAVRVGQMSINQAAIHYNLPYSSLYGRFKRCKYLVAQAQPATQQEVLHTSETAAAGPQQDLSYYQEPHVSESDQLTNQYSQNGFVPHTSTLNNVVIQDPFAGPAMYYNQGFSSIATS